MNNLKQTVKTVTAAAGKSTTQLAEDLGKDPANLRAILRNGNPRMEFLKQVAEACECELQLVNKITNNSYTL